MPLCLRTKEPGEPIRAVELLIPTFGGINLEDIAQPKCFSIFDTHQDPPGNPEWQDDQQGAATACSPGS